MSRGLLRLATAAWADHGGPLRSEGLSPLMTGLLAGRLAHVTGILIVVIELLQPRRPAPPE